MSSHSRKAPRLDNYYEGQSEGPYQGSSSRHGSKMSHSDRDRHSSYRNRSGSPPSRDGSRERDRSYHNKSSYSQRKRDKERYRTDYSGSPKDRGSSSKYHPSTSRRKPYIPQKCEDGLITKRFGEVVQYYSRSKQKNYYYDMGNGNLTWEQPEEWAHRDRLSDDGLACESTHPMRIKKRKIPPSPPSPPDDDETSSPEFVEAIGVPFCNPPPPSDRHSRRSEHSSQRDSRKYGRRRSSPIDLDIRSSASSGTASPPRRPHKYKSSSSRKSSSRKSRSSPKRSRHAPSTSFSRSDKHHSKSSSSRQKNRSDSDRESRRRKTAGGSSSAMRNSVDHEVYSIASSESTDNGGPEENTPLDTPDLPNGVVPNQADNNKKDKRNGDSDNVNINNSAAEKRNSFSTPDKRNREADNNHSTPDKRNRDANIININHSAADKGGPSTSNYADTSANAEKILDQNSAINNSPSLERRKNSAEQKNKVASSDPRLRNSSGSENKPNKTSENNVSTPTKVASTPTTPASKSPRGEIARNSPMVAGPSNESASTSSTAVVPMEVDNAESASKVDTAEAKLAKMEEEAQNARVRRRLEAGMSFEEETPEVKLSPWLTKFFTDAPILPNRGWQSEVLDKQALRCVDEEFHLTCIQTPLIQVALKMERSKNRSIEIELMKLEQNNRFLKEHSINIQKMKMKNAPSQDPPKEKETPPLNTSISASASSSLLLVEKSK